MNETKGTWVSIVMLGALILGVPGCFFTVGLFLWWGGMWSVLTGSTIAIFCYGAGRHFETIHIYMRERAIRKGGPTL